MFLRPSGKKNPKTPWLAVFFFGMVVLSGAAGSLWGAEEKKASVAEEGAKEKLSLKILLGEKAKQSEDVNVVFSKKSIPAEEPGKEDASQEKELAIMKSVLEAKSKKTKGEEALRPKKGTTPEEKEKWNPDLG